MRLLILVVIINIPHNFYMYQHQDDGYTVECGTWLWSVEHGYDVYLSS